jgi:hypothetical protein
MENNSELDNFNSAMDTILRADPKIVKAQMEAEKELRAKVRKAKKALSSSVPASGDVD